MIKLDSLKLEYINYENIEHLNFLKELILSKDMKYLWDLSDVDLQNNKNKEKFIVLNDNDDKIGYLNISDVVDGRLGSTVSIYYAIKENYRGKGYGKRLISEVNKWLLENKTVDCIVAQVDTQNIHSNNTLTNAGMSKAVEDDDYTTFIQNRNR